MRLCECEDSSESSLLENAISINGYAVTSFGANVHCLIILLKKFVTINS